MWLVQCSFIAAGARLAVKAEIAPGLEASRIINGMWQVAGAHGPVDPGAAVRQMHRYHEAGLACWDMADIYGPAEVFFGRFREQLGPREKEEAAALTKFVPNPGPMDFGRVERAVAGSASRMGVDAIDLVQFHWWDYADKRYLDALESLEALRSDGRVRHVGLTNFDTERLREMAGRGLRPVSNQVQCSVLDQRSAAGMAEFCAGHGVKILAYGSLLGGLLSERYLGAPEPSGAELYTASLHKYKNMVDAWGGWGLFQELLSEMGSVARKHSASIANVAVRAVLDMPAVCAAIVGARLGVSEHVEENLRVFGFSLDSDDRARIASVTGRARNLLELIGDCGAEYR